MKEINAQSYLPQVTTFTSRKMGLFIKFYRMKFCLFTRQTKEIHKLMTELENLADPLFLMMIREKDKAEGEYRQALREICEEFKPVYEKVAEKEKKLNDSYLKAVRNYIFSEETSEQKEWEDLILYFEDEAKLEKHIKDNW